MSIEERLAVLEERVESLESALDNARGELESRTERQRRELRRVQQEADDRSARLEDDLRRAQEEQRRTRLVATHPLLAYQTVRRAPGAE
jgi:predicted  nucleic acid-binding Zn-ribbon protein